MTSESGGSDSGSAGSIPLRNGQAVSRDRGELPPATGYLARLARRAASVAQSLPLPGAARPRLPSRFEPSFVDASRDDPFAFGETISETAPFAAARSVLGERETRPPQLASLYSDPFALPSQISVVAAPPPPLPTRTPDASRPFPSPAPAVTDASPRQTEHDETVFRTTPQTPDLTRNSPTRESAPVASAAAVSGSAVPAAQNGGNKEEPRSAAAMSPVSSAPQPAFLPPTQAVSTQDGASSSTLVPSRSTPTRFPNGAERETVSLVSRRDTQETQERAVPPATLLRPVISAVPTLSASSPASPPPQTRARQADPLPPVIQVSIGRIEVRAATSSANAAALPSAKKPSSAPIGDGLSSYLEQRGQTPPQKRER